MSEHYRMYIDGEWTEAKSGRIFESVDPWAQRAWAEVPEGDVEDVDLAVAAAQQAFAHSTWTRSPYERARLLRRLNWIITHICFGHWHLIYEVAGTVKRYPTQGSVTI